MHSYLRRRRFIAATSLLLPLLATGCVPRPVAVGPAASGAAAGSGVDTLTIRAAARFLADDALLGRGTATEGEQRAADYLAAACARLGLAPLGADGYLQPVPLTEATIVGAGTTVRIRGPQLDTTFTYFDEFIPDVGTRETLRGFGGPLVYVGRAQDILFRRSDLPPLEGAVAMLRGEFGASGAAADTLLARGAVGVIEVIDDARRFRLFRQTRGPARLHLADAIGPSSFIPPLPAILAGPRMTVTLYEPITGVTHGSWNDAYLNGLAAGLPAPRALDGWRADVAIHLERRPRTGRNVGCVLRGRGAAADTAIALSAHYDHLGVGIPDARGDSIYNGFSDNAVGVGMALAIGERLAREASAGRSLHHSLLLLFFTGEEHGLLGSDHWATHPAWPLGAIAGLINLDANAPAGRPAAWRVSGEEESRPVREVLAEAQRHGWATTVAPPAPGSDHFAFVRRGVPAVFFVPSDGPYEGLGVTVSDSLRHALWGHYHQPDDEWRADFPFAGLERYANFTLDVVHRLDAPPPARPRR